MYGARRAALIVTANIKINVVKISIHGNLFDTEESARLTRYNVNVQTLRSFFVKQAPIGTRINECA